MGERYGDQSGGIPRRTVHLHLQAEQVAGVLEHEDDNVWAAAFTLADSPSPPAG